MKAKRIVFPARGQVTIEEFEVPEPRTGEVLVRSLVSGISVGTERRLFLRESISARAVWNPEMRFFETNHSLSDSSQPIYPGYETVGVVERALSGDGSVRSGQLVWVDSPHATHHVVKYSEAVLGLLPDGVSPLTGTLLPLTRVALAAVHDAAPLYGERVAVVGLGVVGLLSARFSRLSGATTVAGFDTNAYRVERAKRAGVESYQIDSDLDVVATARMRLQGHGFDSVIECSGSTAGLQLAIRLSGLAAVISAVSTYAGPADGLVLGAEFHRNRLTIRSSMTRYSAPHRRADRWDLKRLMESAGQALKSGAVIGSDFYDASFSFEHAREAYERAFDPENPLLKVALTYE